MRVPSGHPLGIAEKEIGDDLQGNVAPKLSVLRAVDFPHSASAERCRDVKMAKLCAWNVIIASEWSSDTSCEG